MHMHDISTSNMQPTTNMQHTNDASINKTAMESELLGSRLTEEIRRLRGELNHCEQQRHEVTHMLQARQEENDSLRARNKALEQSCDALERDMVRAVFH